MRCPIHEHLLLCDGTLLEGGSQEAQKAMAALTSGSTNDTLARKIGVNSSGVIRPSGNIECKGTYIMSFSELSKGKIQAGVHIFQSESLLPTGERFFGVLFNDLPQRFRQVSMKSFKGIKGIPGESRQVLGTDGFPMTVRMLTNVEPIF
jgi:hypothetical protein